MNKKLYFLDEDEKNRILNLHESATKKQYLLGEQDEGCPNSLTMNVVEDNINQLSQTFKYMEQAFVRMAFQRERAELIYRTIKDLSNKNVFDTVNNVCVNALQYTKDNFSRFDQVGRFSSYGKTLEQYLNTYTKKGSYYDKPEIQRYLNGALEFVNKIGSNKTIQQTTPEATSQQTLPTQRPIGWENYPCVKKGGGKDVILTYKGKKTNWKQIDTDDGRTFYYNDKGKYYIKDENKVRDYECGPDGGIYNLGGSPQKSEISPEEKTKEKQEFANIKPTSSYGYVTRNVQGEIPELMKLAGLEGQTINQDTINKLYDILSKK